MAITLEQAQELIWNSVTPLQAAQLPLAKAAGRVTAEAVYAGMDQPPFPRSPLDGYALRAQDVAGACAQAPATLEVVGKSYAGAPARVRVGQGQAVRIMTGGMIPPGADCVIRQEDTDQGEERARVFVQALPFSNYCPVGEDFHRGDLLVPAGIPASAAVLAVAASAGLERLAVLPPLSAVVLTTGSELRYPGQPLLPGQIYDSNGVYFAARLGELGVKSTVEAAGDHMERLTAAIRRGVEKSDVLITTGGVSVGQRDLVPAALERLGAKTVFHGVAIKPGMPTLFALLSGKPVLALSGNPFSAAVAFEVLGRHLLARLWGDGRFVPVRAAAVLMEDYGKSSPVRRFVRGKTAQGAVELPTAQGNGQLRSMVGCNCLVDIAPGTQKLKAGDTLDLILL